MRIGKRDRYRIIIWKGDSVVFMPHIDIQIGALNLFLGWDYKRNRGGV